MTIFLFSSFTWFFSLRHTYLNIVKLITVTSRPNIDIAHPIQVTIFSDNGLDPLWSMSRSNAKFVKWLHSHLMVPWNFPGSVLQPSFDQARRQILVTYFKIIRTKIELKDHESYPKMEVNSFQVLKKESFLSKYTYYFKELFRSNSQC